MRRSLLREGLREGLRERLREEWLVYQCALGPAGTGTRNCAASSR